MNRGLFGFTLHPQLEPDPRPPVGSILAWYRDMDDVPDLPDGWLECNGQVVKDRASPLLGQTLPNLNGEGRYLRGGSTSGVEAN